MKVEQRRSRHIQRPTSTSRIVWRFGSHFRCVWKHTAHTFGFWAPRKADSYTYLNTLFRWGPGKAYKGRVLAQFERSTHPEHGGTRTVVIRTVKIFELLWAEDVPPDVSLRLPEEGGFALTRNLGRGPTRYVPWSVDVDAYGVRRYRKARNALKLLFDNEEMSLRASQTIDYQTHYVPMHIRAGSSVYDVSRPSTSKRHLRVAYIDQGVLLLTPQEVNARI